MDVLLDFTEALASVPDPVVVAGHVLAAILISSPRWAYGAGVSWGLGLWGLGVLLDPRYDLTVPALSAQFLGSLTGNLIGMWVVLTVASAVRAVRARRSEQSRPGMGKNPYGEPAEPPG